MATNYPTALDTSSNLPNPTGGSFQNNPDHGQQHSNANDAIKALETKLGIGNTAPSSTGLLLIPTGSGTTAWSQLTSAQLAATLTDETGSGSAVFANTPTLLTPKIDTINEATLNNGVTIGGVNLKAGAIAMSAVPTNGVTADKLATSAITLGYSPISTNFSTASTTAVQVTGLSAAVTIPAGGRRIRISAYVANVSATSAPAQYTLSIWDGAVGSGTQLNIGCVSIYSSFNGSSLFAAATTVPAAGSKTYNIGFQVTAGTGTLLAAATSPAFILVEAI